MEEARDEAEMQASKSAAKSAVQWRRIDKLGEVLKLGPCEKVQQAIMERYKESIETPQEVEGSTALETLYPTTRSR